MVTQAWSSFDPARRKGGLIAAMTECLATTLVLWHFVFYGYLETWRVVGKMVVMAGGFLTLAFLLLLLLTGYRALFEAADTPENDN